MAKHKPELLRAYIALVAHRAVKKFEASSPKGWLRSAVKTTDLEREVRKAIRAALRAAN